MGFKMPELIVESVIRDGLKSLRNDPDQLDDVLEIMEADFASTKYGKKEINKIKNFFQTKEVKVVHAFHQVPAAIPCFSIQLNSDAEAADLAHLDDYEEERIEPETDPEDIANRIIVASLTPDSYDVNTGLLRIPDSVDLSNVGVNHIFVDAGKAEHSITGALDNRIGLKKFGIAKGSTVTLGGGSIKSSIDYKQFEGRGVIDNEQLLLGIHTDEPLLTKYLYTILKYVLQSRKLDLIIRGFKRITFSGSDFTRNLDYNEPVFSRFLTLTGITENDWKAQEITPIENVQVTVLVEKDEATTEQLGLENSSLQVTDDDSES